MSDDKLLGVLFREGFNDGEEPTNELVDAKKKIITEDLETPAHDRNAGTKVQPLPDPSAGGSELGGAAALNASAASREKERIKVIESDLGKTKEEARRRLEAAKREADRQKRMADAQNAKRLEQERIDRALREAQAALDKNKNIPRSTLDGVRDPVIRKNLVHAVAAQELNKRLESEKKKSELSLAQLLQMAAVTLQAATAMNSMNNGSGPQGSQNLDLTQPVAPRGALGNRSPASLGDKAGISHKSDGPEIAEGGQAAKEAEEKAAKDKETVAKIKTEVDAAEKRKQILALRLKQKLREKAKSQGGAIGAVDTEELFGGALANDLQSSSSDEVEEESAAKSSAMSAYSVFQAARDGFSLAGPETDREVGYLVSEAQRELSSEDMSSGVLGRESPSLFQRVHSLHQACQRKKCVLPRSN